jgi:two-component system phosphate regulon sensor histidine kinase PhoR
MKGLALPWTSVGIAVAAGLAMPFAGASLWLAFAVVVVWLASLWLASPEPEIVQVRPRKAASRARRWSRWSSRSACRC